MRYVTVQVLPRSTKNMLVGTLADGTIKIKLTAPPVDGAANELLIQFLRDLWHIPKSHLRIIRGQRGKRKVIEITE